MDRDTVRQPDAVELTRRSIQHIPEHTLNVIINGLMVAAGLVVTVGAIGVYLHAAPGL